MPSGGARPCEPGCKCGRHINTSVAKRNRQRSKNRQAYPLFFSVRPKPPWVCFFCGKKIMSRGRGGSRSLHIHHINGDHGDNRIRNMAASHADCHIRYHREGKSWTPKQRQAILAGRKGKILTGESHPSAKLTARQVIAMREAFANGTASRQELADRYAITRETVNKIIRRDRWRDV